MSETSSGLLEAEIKSDAHPSSIEPGVFKEVSDFLKTLDDSEVKPSLIPTSREHIKKAAGKERKPPVDVGLMEDEFHERAVPILTPLKDVVIQVPDYDKPPRSSEDRPMKPQDITGVIATQYDYLSRTAGLEVNTEQTNYIQDTIINPMLKAAESDMETRVVIINKSASENAFVLPDGTIFVTQALINKAASADHLASVLAHELNHLLLKTTVNIGQANQKDEFGVGWLHESGCDLKAKPLLEKAGFNSLAFSSMIYDVSGTNRGTVHQSGLARASQSVGQHYYVDSTTSTKELTPLPEFMKKESGKTNLEIAQELVNWKIEKNDKVGAAEKREQLREVIQLLAPEDLLTFYFDNNARYLTPEVKPFCNDLIQRRLGENGYSQNETEIFLLALGQLHLWNGFNPFKTPEDVVRLTEAFPDFERTNQLSNITQLVFNKNDVSYIRDSFSQARFTEFLSRSFYDEQVNYIFEKQSVSFLQEIPINRQSIVEVLDLLSHSPLNDKVSENYTQLSHLARAYLYRTYLLAASEAGEVLDIEQIKGFFEECKERDIMFTDYIILGNDDSPYEVTLQTGEVIRVSHENQQVIKDAFREVYEIEKEGQVEPFKLDDIDSFFEENKNSSLNGNLTALLVGNIDRYCKDNEFTDQQTLELLRSIAQKIDDAHLETYINVPEFLETGKADIDVRPQEESLPFAVFSLKMAIGLQVFKEDSPEFYQYMNEIVNTPNLSLDELNRRQLINLSSGMFAAANDSRSVLKNAYWFGDRQNVLFVKTNISDFESFLHLPFMQRILEKEERREVNSWREMNDYAAETYKGLVRVSGDKNSIYDEDILTTIIARDLRRNAERLLEQEIPDEELSSIGSFLQEYFPSGYQRTQYIREIQKRVLSSDFLSFDHKIDFVIENFDSIGPEGMRSLAEMITDISTYEAFRARMEGRIEQYLEGGGLVSTAARVDVASSFASMGFDPLLATASENPKTKIEMSTSIAEQWFRRIFDIPGTPSTTRVQFDQEKGKFIMNQSAREQFKSLSDINGSLQNLSELQRFFLVHKALTDQYGGFSSQKNREKLGDSIVEALNLKKGFLSDTLKAATLHADPIYSVFPASAMTGGLLFRSLDTQAVDIGKLKKRWVYNDAGEYVPLEEVLSDKEIRNILSLSTREIALFGAKYREDPSTLAAQLTEENDDAYDQFNGRLAILFKETDESVEKEHETVKIDPELEAVIQGVEGGGAIGKRSLQLTTQFQKFPPHIEARLSESFDRNKGLEKIAFWENLYKLSQEDMRVNEFVRRIRVGDYIGGGSLQTAYRADYIRDDGSERPIVLKMTSPNVQAFIESTYKSVQATFDAVEKKGGKSRDYAKTGKVLIDLAQQWCLEDINDQTFEEDDDAFKTTIEQFNLFGGGVFEMGMGYTEEYGAARFYSPARVFTHEKIKAEDLAPERTLNQYLQDETVHPAEKKGAIEGLTNFFLFQMKAPNLTRENGEQVYLVHSDPHVGNYMVSESGQYLEMGVIDRSLFLKLSKEDMDVMNMLLVKGNNTQFVDAFTDRVLDINKVRGARRALIKGSVYASLGKEVATQMTRGGVDRFKLMRTLLTELSTKKVGSGKSGEDSNGERREPNSELQIPLNLRLMIRNIGAFQELTKKYGVDMEQLSLDMDEKLREAA